MRPHHQHVSKSGIVRFTINKQEPTRNIPLGELAGGSLPPESELQSQKTLEHTGKAFSDVANLDYRGLSNPLSKRPSMRSAIRLHPEEASSPPGKQVMADPVEESFHMAEEEEAAVAGAGGEPRKCEICDKKAEFACQCNEAFYCSEEHHAQHFQEVHKHSCKAYQEELEDNNLLLQFKRSEQIDTPKRKQELQDSRWRVQDYKKNREQVINALCHNKEELIQGVQTIYNRQISRAESIKAESNPPMRELFEILVDLVLFVKVKYIYQNSLDYDVEHALNQLRRILTTCIKITGKIIKDDEQAKADVLLSAITPARGAGQDDLSSPEDASSQRTKKTGAQAKNQIGSHTQPTKYDLQWIFSLIGYVANFFNLIQLYRECEEIYAFYGRQVEKLFGSQSLEASNVYFLLGIFYFERRWFIKARAAFDKALYLRKLQFGVQHASCAECLYNIALTAKLQDERQEAYKLFQQVADIYQKTVGANSLQSAKVKEQLGRMHLEDGEVEKSYDYINHCHQIRERLIRDPAHSELKKSSGLLFILRGKVKQLLGTENQKNMSFSIEQGLESSSDDSGQTEEWQAEYSSNGEGSDQPHRSLEWKGKGPTRDIIQVRGTLRDQRMSNQMMRKSVAESVIDEHDEYEEHKTLQTAHWETLQGAGGVGGGKKSFSKHSKTTSKHSKNHRYGTIKSEIKLQQQQSRYQPRRDDFEDQSDDSQDSGLFWNDQERVEAVAQVEKGIADVIDLSREAEIFEQLPILHQLFLSFNQAQMDIFNKTQMDFKPERPLLIAESFQQTLQQMQRALIDKSKLSEIPRFYILEKADRKLSIQNLKYLKREQDNEAAKNEQSQLIKLLLESREMMNILKQPQREILRNCIQHRLSLEYFTNSIKGYQMKEFQGLLQSQVSQVENAFQTKDEASKFEGYFKKPPPNLELGRGVFASPELAREAILGAVESLTIEELFEQLDLNFSEKLAGNFEVEQLSLINQLRYCVNNPTKQDQRAKNILLSLLNGFDLRELYEFLLYNQYLPLSKYESVPTIVSDEIAYLLQIRQLFSEDQIRLNKVDLMFQDFQTSSVDLLSNLQRGLPMSKEVALRIYSVFPSVQEQNFVIKQARGHPMEEVIDGLDSIDASEALRFLILSCFVKRLGERLSAVLSE